MYDFGQTKVFDFNIYTDDLVYFILFFADILKNCESDLLNNTNLFSDDNILSEFEDSSLPMEEGDLDFNNFMRSSPEIKQNNIESSPLLYHEVVSPNQNSNSSLKVLPDLAGGNGVAGPPAPPASRFKIQQRHFQNQINSRTTVGGVNNTQQQPQPQQQQQHEKTITAAAPTTVFSAGGSHYTISPNLNFVSSPVVTLAAAAVSPAQQQQQHQQQRKILLPAKIIKSEPLVYSTTTGIATSITNSHNNNSHNLSIQNINTTNAAASVQHHHHHHQIHTLLNTGSGTVLATGNCTQNFKYLSVFIFSSILFDALINKVRIRRLLIKVEGSMSNYKGQGIGCLIITTETLKRNIFNYFNYFFCLNYIWYPKICDLIRRSLSYLGAELEFFEKQLEF